MRKYFQTGIIFIRIQHIINLVYQTQYIMCGRLFQTLPLSRLLRIARTSRVSNSQLHSSSFNVCPTTYIPVIKRSKIYEKNEQKGEIEEKQENQKSLDDQMRLAIEEEGEQRTDQIKNDENRQLTFMKWGQKTNFNMIINGRIEQLTSKRTFLKIIENRCVVIMEGYYQWKSKQQPFCFKPKNSDHFLVAGLYTEENQIIILTKDATPELSKIHERMPVILSHTQVQIWLDPKNTKQINLIIQKCLTNKSKSIWKNVSFAKLAPYVNKRQDKSKKCLMTIQQYKKQLDSKGIMRFWKKKQPVETVGKQGETLKQKPEIKQKQLNLQIQKRDPTNCCFNQVQKNSDNPQ